MLSQLIMCYPIAWWIKWRITQCGRDYALLPADTQGARDLPDKVVYWRKFFMDAPVRDLSALIPPLLELCRKAGEVIWRHYHAPGADRFQTKGDDSPLTHADLDSHATLHAGLSGLTPELPILSEESDQADLADRHQWPEYWLVDPLDGTKEFLTRTGEFTINIALIDAHRPVLGVLYLPLKQAAYVGIPGVMASCYTLDGQWQQRALAVRALPEGQPLKVLASRRHAGPRLRACLEWLQQQCGPIERLNSGSALKFCQLAEGEGDFYPRFSPCCEWDTAAGQAVLEAAGGALLGMDGLPLTYNCRESLFSPDFYAIGDRGHTLWQALLARRFGD
jgi:3'(2'), 5'-bisphosphate nucleotidase